MTTDFALRSATGADRHAIIVQLKSAGLPVDGADDAEFIVAESAGVIVGCAAMERRGATGLLRSVAVDATRRGCGVGDALVTRILGDASREHIDSVVLLTTTAANWFVRYGFTRIARDAVPAPLLASAEFQGACPAAAVIMQRTVTTAARERR